MTNTKEHILQLMQNIYYEDERRNALIDTKNSIMIILTGMYFIWICTALITNQSIIILIPLIFIILSFVFFNKALFFRHDYMSAPNPEYLEYYQDEITCTELINNIIKIYSTSISHNQCILESKIKDGKKGFIFLILSIGCYLFFILMLLR